MANKNEEYAHGGLSIQECLIPQLLIDAANNQMSGRITSVKWINLTCKIELQSAADGYTVDIRAKATDEKTSIVLSSTDKKIVKDSKSSLMADDGSEGSAAWVVLMTSSGIIVDKMMTSVGH